MDGRKLAQPDWGWRVFKEASSSCGVVAASCPTTQRLGVWIPFPGVLGQDTEPQVLAHWLMNQRLFGHPLRVQKHYISAIHFSLKGTTDYKTSSWARNTSSTQPSVPEQLNTFLTFLQDSSSSGRGPDPDTSGSSPRSEQPLCSLKPASQEEHYTASTAIKQIGLIAWWDVCWTGGQWTTSLSIHSSLSRTTTVDQLQVTCMTNKPTDDGMTFMHKFTHYNSCSKLCWNLCIQSNLIIIMSCCYFWLLHLIFYHFLFVVLTIWVCCSNNC